MLFVVMVRFYALFFQHMFPTVQSIEKVWPFEKEVAQVKIQKRGKALPDDKNYVEDKTIPDDIEERVFPKMNKGQRLDDMATARQIEADLNEQGITKPRIPHALWLVSYCF